MTEESETPLGVKMLADHLVKVKLQYEGIDEMIKEWCVERINDLLLHIRGVEKEKVELQKRYKLVEDELELRRNEIYQMKREASAQYVIEERENWKAMLNQERKLNEKLNKGISLLFELNVDLEIYKSRLVLLEEQLKNEIEAPSIKVESIQSEELVISPEEQTELIEPTETTDPLLVPSISEETTEESLIISSAGPPQPELPPGAEIDGMSIESLQEQKAELEREIQSIREEIDKLQKELDESKQINLYRLLMEFRIDDLQINSFIRWTHLKPIIAYCSFLCLK